jgi:hypothetical protein
MSQVTDGFITRDRIIYDVNKLVNMISELKKESESNKCLGKYAEDALEEKNTLLLEEVKEWEVKYNKLRNEHSVLVEAYNEMHKEVQSLRPMGKALKVLVTLSEKHR